MNAMSRRPDPIAAPPEQRQQCVGFTLMPRYKAVSAMSYMRDYCSTNGMDCSILKSYCMLVHHTNQQHLWLGVCRSELLGVGSSRLAETVIVRA